MNQRRRGTPLLVERLEDRTLLSSFLQAVSPLNAPLSHSDSAGGVSQIKNSADGRYIVYTSAAPNVVTGQTNQSVANNIFLYDSVAHTTTLVSHRAGNPDETANGPSAFGRISANDTYILFASGATDLVAGQTGPLTGGNVYLYNVSNGATSLVSHRSDSNTISANDFSSTEGSTGFGFSATNDRYLLFASYATDLVQFQTGPGRSNVFRYDTQTGQNVLVSHTYFATPTSAAGGNDDTFAADISGDGNSVAFSSLSTNLVNMTLATNHLPIDLYLWTAGTGAVQLLSGVFDPSTGKNSPTVAAGLGSFAVPAISADGLAITFISAATDLVLNQQTTSTPPPGQVFTYYTYLGATFMDSSIEDTSGQPTLNIMSNGIAEAVAVSGQTNTNFTIAFISSSTNITPNQGNNAGNVFLFQPFMGAKGTVTIASSIASSSTVQGAGGCPVDPESDLTDLSISGDGRFVSYQSQATDIVPGQGTSALGPNLNVFLYDHNAATNTLLSHVPGNNALGGDNNCDASRVSTNGSAVAFLSLSTNLVTGAAINASGEDLYSYNVGSNGPVVLNSPAAFAANATSLVFGTSADGRYAVFISNSPSLLTGQIDFNRDADVFVLDRQTGIISLVSHIPSNFLMTGDFGSPATNAGVVQPGAPVVISPDGNWIAFVSRAGNLVPGQTTGSPFIDATFIDNVFLYDNRPGQTHGKITMVSHVAGSDNTEGEASSFNPVISSSSTGVFVAFVSFAKSLVAGLTGFQNDRFRANVFLYNATNDSMNILSDLGSSAVTGNGDSRNPTISDDGRFIAFQSRATNLIPGDTVFPTNNIYVVDQFTPGGNTTLVSHVVGDPTSSPDPSTSPGGPPSVASFDPVMSGDGGTIAFVSYATNLVTGQSGQVDTTDIFLYSRPTGTNRLVSGASGSAFVTADNYSDSPSIDTNGSAVAFRSSANNLVAQQSGPAGSNVFLASSAGITLISHAAGAPTTTAAGDSIIPFIDGDAGLVTYLSTASNLVPGQSAGGINNVFGWIASNDLNFLASGQNGSPTAISPSPAFLPLISRDPQVFFSVTGTLLTNGVGSTNAYANTLISISFTPSALLDGSPPGTMIGTLSSSSVLIGQLVLAQFSLPAGSAPDNNKFSAGPTQLDGTASLLAQFTVNIALQSIFSIVVQAATGLGNLDLALNLDVNKGGGSITTDYLDHLYSDILQRQPDPSGLTNFSAGLDAGITTCPQVAAALVGSPEYHTIEVQNAYQSILGRPADPGGLSFWVSFLNSGHALVQLQALFYGGAEFFNKNGGNNSSFVAALYPDILHRQEDPSSSNWVTLLNNGVPATAVAGAILATPEADGVAVGGLYQNYLHRPADPTGLQNNVNALLHGATYEQVLIGLVSSPEYQRDAGGDLSEHFVSNLFADLLNRAPDSGGLANFAGAIDSGALTRSQVVTTMLNSTEYRTDVVKSIYLEYLNRAADIGGLNNAVAVLTAGGTDEAVAAALLGSAEFFNDNGGNDTGFVLALYKDVLKRSSAPSQNEIAGWVAALQSGAPLSAVAGAFLVTDEYHRVLANAYYPTYLHRSPDPGGFAGLVATLDAGHTDESVIASLVASAEYYAR